MGKNPAQKAKEIEEKKKAAEGRPAKEKKVAKKKVAAADVAIKEKICTIQSCKRAYRAKGYCRVHYKKWRQGEYGKTRYTCCTDFGCFKPMSKNRHGYCETHYQNYYVKGMAVAAAPEAAAPAAEKPAASA